MEEKDKTVKARRKVSRQKKPGALFLAPGLNRAGGAPYLPCFNRVVTFVVSCGWITAEALPVLFPVL